VALVEMLNILEGYDLGAMGPGAGFLLNNEMGDFNGKPGLTDSTGLIGTAPNLARPGKRMLSSMTPSIVAKDGNCGLSAYRFFGLRPTSGRMC
jgi:gamma-glutamyltranspeptidase